MILEGCSGADRMHLAQDRVQWWALLDTVMNPLIL